MLIRRDFPCVFLDWVLILKGFFFVVFTQLKQIMSTQTSDSEICCPEFQPEYWNEKTHIWSEKPFIADSVITFFYMPVNFGAVMRRLNAKVEAAEAEMPDWLCLSDHRSAWKMDLYLAINKTVANAKNMRMNGSFYSKVFEGAYKDAGKMMKQFEDHLQSNNLQVSKKYTWYTTCPKCAKKYGKNYIVLFAQLIE